MEDIVSHKGDGATVARVRCILIMDIGGVVLRRYFLRLSIMHHRIRSCLVRKLVVGNDVEAAKIVKVQLHVIHCVGFVRLFNEGALYWHCGCVIAP